jgi:hypothetical protein
MPVQELRASKIAIKEVLKPVDMAILDDYIIFQNEYINGEDCFYVYSSDKMKFCYSFGRLGQGPGEFIAPRIVQNSFGNIISIYDSAFGKMVNFSISGQNAERMNEKKIIFTPYPVQNISYVNDTTILYFIQTNTYSNLYSHNLISNNIIDTLSFDTKIREKMGQNYNQMFDFFCFSNYERKYVITFNFMDEVIIGLLDEEGKFTKIDHAFKDVTFNSQIVENVFHYMFPIATENFVYTQYYGRLFYYMQPFPFNMKGRNFDFLIEVYDWEKNSIRILHLESEILRFYINRKTNKLYAWNLLEDFDYLLEYELQ